MENENVQEQELDTNLDEATEESSDVDYKAEAAKYKAIAERKAKQLEKVQAGLSEEETETKTIKKTNTEPQGATMEHSYLFAQGLSLDEVKLVEKAAQLDGVSLIDAYGDDFVRSKIDRARKEADVKKNTLPPSGGSPNVPREKTVKNMTVEEHRAFAQDKLKNAING